MLRLAAEVGIALLVLEEWLVTKRPNPLAALLVAASSGGVALADDPRLDAARDAARARRPCRCGAYALETSERILGGGDDEGGGDGGSAVTRVRCRMPAARVAAPDTRDGWFELTDDLEAAVLEAADGSVTVEEIVRALTRDGEDEHDGEGADAREILLRLTRLWDRCLLHFDP